MEETLISNLGSAMLHIRKASIALTEQMELNLMELLAMRALAHNELESDGNVYAQDLAVQLHASKAAVSQMLASLEHRQYLERSFNLSNRRKVSLTLTDAGRQSLTLAMEKYARMMSEVISDFGEDNAVALADLFDRFATSIEQKALRSQQNE